MPLKEEKRINERLDLTEFFIKEIDLRNKASMHLKQCGDVERLVSKIPMKKINPREVMQIARGLDHIHKIKELSINTGNDYLKRLADTLNPCQYIFERIINDLVDHPPVVMNKGSIIRDGVSTELDELRSIASGGK